MTRLVSLVVGAAPLASKAVDVAEVLTAAGWTVKTVASPTGISWVDEEGILRATGRTVASTYRQPDQPKSDPRPDAIVACPLTFNTGNKVAAGIMDNYALGTLCEGIGTGVPVVFVPMVNNYLWRHPAWINSLSRFQEAGVYFVDPHTGRVGPPAPVQSGTGGQVVADFQPVWLRDVLEAQPAQKY